MQNEIVAIPDSLWLQDHFKAYSNPKAKIAALLRQKTLIRLKRGKYLRSDLVHKPRYLAKAANTLYGPSYVSFLFALRWHGLIPEHVPNITSAAYGKNKGKRFDTDAGIFFYQNIPPAVYYLSVGLESGGTPRFLIASPEKALCDQIYTISGIRTLAGLEDLIFDDLRIDPEVFEKLDFERLIFLSRYYRTESLETMNKYLKRKRSA